MFCMVGSLLIEVWVDSLVTFEINGKRYNLYFGQWHTEAIAGIKIALGSEFAIYRTIFAQMWTDCDEIWHKGRCPQTNFEGTKLRDGTHIHTIYVSENVTVWWLGDT